MGADDLPPLSLHDQLAEAFRLTVGNGAQQILLPGHGDRAVILARACSSVSPTLAYSGSVKLPVGTIS